MCFAHSLLPGRRDVAYARQQFLPGRTMRQSHISLYFRFSRRLLQYFSLPRETPATITILPRARHLCERDTLFSGRQASEDIRQSICLILGFYRFSADANILSRDAS